MKKRIVFIIIFLLLFPSSLTYVSSKNSISEPTNENPSLAIQYYDQGCRYPIQGWVYVQIKGDPYERGYQYGHLLYEEITDLMTRWSNMILNHPDIKPYRERLTQQQYDTIASKYWDFCTNLAEDMYWDEYPEEYRQEMRGIAAGITDHGGTIHGNPVSYADILAHNEMYEILSKITDRKIRKGFHPLFTLYNLIKPDFETVGTLSVDSFINGFFPDPDTPVHHHCSSFIATGNATTDGQIILSNSMWSSKDGAGMWWWAHYIAIRWNIILDVIPTDGYRFQMSCAPGYIWSDHDFYQNNAGIMFIETTLPQGIWKEKGLPLAVRARRAVQYADSIDEVITSLRTDNDGVMNAVWLIGDAKTGEIARYELGLYQDAIIERTTNGFQWSANNPIDFGVRWEKMDWKLLFQQLIYHIVLGMDNYQYHTPWYLPAARDIAFEEHGLNNYGKIDVEVVKQIMGTEPVGTYSPDCKITSSNLVLNNGMWVITGSPVKKTLEMANFDQPTVLWEEILPVGWVNIYGRNEEQDYVSSAPDISTSEVPNVLWKTQTNTTVNDFSTGSVIVDDIIYSTSSTGYLYAMDVQSGSLLWSKYIGTNPTEPVHIDNTLFIGTREGLKKVDVGWLQIGEKQIDPVVSTPVIYDDSVFVGTETGRCYAFDVESGATQWDISFNGAVHLATSNSSIVVASAGYDIYGLESETGQILWQMTNDGVHTSQPYVINEVAYVGSWDSNLYAIEILNGSLLWSFETGWGVETTPVITNEMVIFGSHDGILYALNATTGNLVWKKASGAGIHGSPAISNDYVVFGSDNGYIYCLDIESGQEEWKFAPGRTIQNAQKNYFTTAMCSDLEIVDNKVIFGACGSFYALRLD